MDEILKEAEAMALKLITQGKLLREFDLRMILRQVMSEHMKGEITKKEDEPS